MKYFILFLIPFLSFLPPSYAISSIEEVSELRKVYTGKLKDLKARYQKLSDRADIVPNINDGRLTSVSGAPVTSTQTVNVRRIRYTPYRGNMISLYYKSAWRVYRFTELTFDLNTVQATTVPDTNYDVFAYYVNTTASLALELGPAWSSNTARSTALDTQNGILVKGGDATRKYLGTIHTNASSDPERFTDTMDIRGIWNYYNRVPRPLRTNDNTDTWTYNATAFRQADGLATNQLSYVVGYNDVLVRAVAKSGTVSNDATNRASAVGIGIDSSTTNSAMLFGGSGNVSTTLAVQTWAEYLGYPGLGYRTIYWIERCPGCTLTIGQEVTFLGDNGSNQNESGLMLEVDG